METNEYDFPIDPTFLIPPFDCNTYPGPRMDLEQMLQALRRNRRFAKYIQGLVIASNAGVAGAHECLAKYYTPASDELIELGLTDPNLLESDGTLKCTDHSHLIQAASFGYP